MNLLSQAAGIIPYIVKDKIIYILLGLERYKWSGFVGGYEERDKTIIDTAVREFNEETAMIFEKYTGYIYSSIGKSRRVVDKTPSGRTVYLWFVEFPPEAFDEIDKFEENKKKYTSPFFNEKSELKIFTLDEIKLSKNIFYLCKKRIQKTFIEN